MFPYNRIINKWLALVVAIAMAINSLGVMPAYAQGILGLPVPGSMVPLSAAFVPSTLKGMKIDPAHPFQFNFVMDEGQAPLNEQELKNESSELIRYFLAGLTVPEKDLWVNLSPYEKERIAPTDFGQTEMGRDLLAQDYLLKQLTASLLYPDGDVGKAFWQKVYAEAYQSLGTTDVPVDTFHKVWIVPEKAVVYTEGQSVFVVKSHLKVMLETDYVAANQRAERVGGEVPNPVSSALAQRTVGREDEGRGTNAAVSSSDVLASPEGTRERPTSNEADVAKNILREVIVPILEKEVNQGQHFAKLRQIYHSLILAKWYKSRLKESLLTRVYADQGKIDGVKAEDTVIKEKIYEQYVQSFKTGVFNFIKEEVDPATQTVVPRHYFSGGFSLEGEVASTQDRAMLTAASRSWQNVRSVQGNFGILKDAAQARNDIERDLAGRFISDQGLKDLGLNVKTYNNDNPDYYGHPVLRYFGDSFREVSTRPIMKRIVSGERVSPEEAQKTKALIEGFQNISDPKGLRDTIDHLYASLARLKKRSEALNDYFHKKYYREEGYEQNKDPEIFQQEGEYVKRLLLVSLCEAAYRLDQVAQLLGQLPEGALKNRLEAFIKDSRFETLIRFRAKYPAVEKLRLLENSGLEAVEHYLYNHHYSFDNSHWRSQTQDPHADDDSLFLIYLFQYNRTGRVDLVLHPEFRVIGDSSRYDGRLYLRESDSLTEKSLSQKPSSELFRQLGADVKVLREGYFDQMVAEAERVQQKFDDTAFDKFPEEIVSLLSDVELGLGGASMIRDMHAYPRNSDVVGELKLKKLWNPVIEGNGRIDRMDVDISALQNLFLVTGYNEAGKSTLIKAIVQAVFCKFVGLPSPVQAGSVIGEFKRIFTVTQDLQHVKQQGDSQHSGYVRQLKELIKIAGPGDIALIDESHMGSEYADLVAITSVLIEELKKTGATVLFATHLKEVVPILQGVFPDLQPQQVIIDKKGHHRLLPGIVHSSQSTSTLRKLNAPKELIQWAEVFHTALAEKRPVKERELLPQRPRKPSSKEDYRAHRLERVKLLQRIMTELYDPQKTFFFQTKAFDLLVPDPAVFKAWMGLPVEEVKAWRERLLPLHVKNEIEQMLDEGDFPAVSQKMMDHLILASDEFSSRFEEFRRDHPGLVVRKQQVYHWKESPQLLEFIGKLEQVVANQPRDNDERFREYRLRELSESLLEVFDTYMKGFLGAIDVNSGLAIRAHQKGFLAPRKGPLSVQQGRPVSFEGGTPFDLENELKQMQVILMGPNKSGKTTIVETLFLLVELARRGLPLPGDIQLPEYDRVLTFFGAEEMMAQGQSYFNSVASRLLDIIALATEKSIVFMDEIHGSDYWELSALQAAVIKYLDGIGATVVLNTHMREGLKLVQDMKLANVVFLKTDVEMNEDGTIKKFPYTVSPDPDLKSRSLGVESVADILGEDMARRAALRRSQVQEKQKDAAMRPQDVGGIDLDLGLVDLESTGPKVVFFDSAENTNGMDMTGLTPLITHIEAVSNVFAFIQ